MHIHSEVWQDDSARVFLPSWRRPVGYVFQETSLFEHLNVQGNLEFGLRRSARQDRNGLNEAIDLLCIGPLLGRRVAPVRR